MSYIGKTPTIGNFQVCDAISTVNGQAAYTMQVSSVNVSPETANHMLVSLNGILQAPTTSYTVSGSTITFASNLVTGDVIDFIQILGNVLDLGVPSDSTVSTAKIVDGAVTYAKASGFGKVLQVVQTTTTSDLSNNTTSYVASGFTAALTPSATSSKILIQLSGGSMDYDAATLDVFCALYTDTGGGGYSATTSFTKTRQGSGFGMPNCQTLLLSPNTTSAVTVQPYVKSSTTNRAYINRNSALLTLTLTEIGG